MTLLKALALSALLAAPSVFGGSASITVNAQKDVAPVSRRLFGVNLRPNMQETPAVRAFLKDTGFTLFRYQTKDWHPRVNYQGSVPLLAAHATRTADRHGLQLLVVNRDEANPTETEINLLGFKPRAQVETLTLNGPSALSHNDVANREPVYHSFANAPEPIVKVTRSTWTGAQTQFRYSFPAHSVTVLRLEAE